MKKKQVFWKNFYVWEAGKTNGAHCDIVEKLKGLGQTEVDTPEECDYLLVFCPVVSRVGTDIGEALNNITRGKPLILVVMHQTFDCHHVVAESRRHVVNNKNVHLTVDCLFYNGSLLYCNQNNIMWDQIKDHFEVSTSPVTQWRHWIVALLEKFSKIVIGIGLAVFAYIGLRRLWKTVFNK